MDRPAFSRAAQIAAALCGIAGVLMIGTSFGINTGPPLDAGTPQMIEFARTHFHQVMWGAWLQAVGPFLIMVFAGTLVCMANATNRLSGWLTLMGGGVLMMVSLSEVVCYICALGGNPETMGLIGNAIGHAIQHLYFIIAAPALFIPLGTVLLRTPVLPKTFAVLALILGGAFFVLGITSLNTLILSSAVTSLAAIQAFWWLAAAIALIVRSGRAQAAAPEMRRA